LSVEEYAKKQAETREGMKSKKEDGMKIETWATRK
jgi:hypothetical protein